MAISELVSRHIYKRTLSTKTIQFTFLVPEDRSGHKRQKYQIFQKNDTQATEFNERIFTRPTKIKPIYILQIQVFRCTL